MKPVVAFLTQSCKEGIRIYWTLFRLAFPLLLIVNLLEYFFGVIGYVGDWLAPLMNLVGLPGASGVILATGMLLQIYAAILLLASLWTQLDLSTAQATVLMAMILVAHSLPVESRIVQKAGMRLWAAIVLRCVGAFTLGFLLHHSYNDNFLQEPANLLFLPATTDSGWQSWLLNEGRNWLSIFFIILLLVIFINLLKVSRAEHHLNALLLPLLRPLGIREKTMTMTMVGMLLGLSYGGGLLIEESRRGSMCRRDSLCVLTLLLLCHSVIEDTLVVMLVGAHWSGVLLGRIIFSVIFMLVFSRLVARMSDAMLDKIAAPAAGGS